MANEEITSILGSNNVIVNGITYFKLVSEYDGDYTKNCGLLGEEVDQNFYFLRGHDIDTIEMDGNKNLIIKRKDEKLPPLTVNLSEGYGNPTFQYFKEEGKLKVTYPDGTYSIVEGFYVKNIDDKIYVDNTMKGKGTLNEPFGVSNILSTGVYAPADEFFDITLTRQMPEGKRNGYRIVTKETFNELGLFYPFDALSIIKNKLEASESQWRIPTKEEWDDLLNAFECEEDKNHSATTSTYLGKKAGVALKSAGVYHNQIGDGDGLWKEYQVPSTEDPVYGQDIAKIAILPLGHCPERNSIMRDVDNDAEGIGKLGSFWCNTSDDDGLSFVKTFSYDSAKVRQFKKDKTAKMSLRLVKDNINTNYHKVEKILGLMYPTEIVRSPLDETYNKIWTAINVYDSSPELSGCTSFEWSAITSGNTTFQEKYYINEWDGYKWHKKDMNNGDSVVIINYENSGETASYHEWMIVNNKLIDLTKKNEEKVKTIVKDYLIGTQYEIQLQEENDKLRISFDEDAIFGELK